MRIGQQFASFIFPIAAVATKISKLTNWCRCRHHWCFLPLSSPTPMDFPRRRGVEKMATNAAAIYCRCEKSPDVLSACLSRLCVSGGDGKRSGRGPLREAGHDDGHLEHLRCGQRALPGQHLGTLPTKNFGFRGHEVRRGHLLEIRVIFVFVGLLNLAYAVSPGFT